MPLPSRLRRVASRSDPIRPDPAASPRLTTRIGSVTLPNPILTAAGTAGFGTEFAAYIDPAEIGALVVKSLSAQPWAGNPAPRLTETDAGMLNSVGLENPGVDTWRRDHLPALQAVGARTVASIWGFRVGEYAQAAAALRDAPGVVAVEVNVSCPNVEDRRHMFGHSTEGTAEVIGAVVDALRPLAGAQHRVLPVWAKLSPNVTDITGIAAAALAAGAEALTLTNTLMGLVIDPDTRRPRLGAGGGGLSGPAIRPVALRAVYECRKAFPDAAIIGLGGVAHGEHAIEFLLAGADAVGVGTATFYDPRAPMRVLDQVRHWCIDRQIASLDDLIGAAHG